MQLTDRAVETRKGETLASERLEAFLLEAMPELQGPLEIKQFPSGFSNLTYLLRFANRDLVLRRLGLGPDWRPAQDEIAVGETQPIGQIGEAAGELFDFQRSPKPRHRCEEKGFQPLGRERLSLSGLHGAVGQFHVVDASCLSFTW